MPKRVIFEDAGDTFSINENGSLVMRDDDGERVLVRSPELEDFASWLNGEVDDISANKAEAEITAQRQAVAMAS